MFTLGKHQSGELCCLITGLVDTISVISGKRAGDYKKSRVQLNPVCDYKDFYLRQGPNSGSLDQLASALPNGAPNTIENGTEHLNGPGLNSILSRGPVFFFFFFRFFLLHLQSMDPVHLYGTDIRHISSIYIYSRTSMARTPLGP